MDTLPAGAELYLDESIAGDPSVAERFRSTIANALEGIFQTTPEGRYTCINPALARIYGYASPREMAESLRGADNGLYVQPTRRDEFVREMRRAGSVSNFVSQVRRKDGATISISENAREVRDARGELLYYEGTVEDISERLVIEDELRLSIERFERASRATHDVIWEWNIPSDTLWWSPNVEAVLGWTPKELGSAIEGWTARAHPEDAPAVVSSLQAAIDAGQNDWSREYRFRRKDGSWATVYDRGIVLRDAAGGARRVIGSLEDVTERRRAERELRDSEARFRALTEVSSDWFWENDSEMRITRLEGGYFKRMGFDPSRFIGRRAPELEGMDPEWEGWQKLRDLVARHEPFRDFEYAQTIDGYRMHYSLSGAPVFDADGRFTGYRGTGTDITRRHNADERLRRFRAAMNISPDAFFLIELGERPRIIDVNDAACRALGYEREALIGAHPGTLGTEGAEVRVEADYEALLSSPGRSALLRRHLKRKDGSTLQVEITRKVLETDNGLYVVSIARDISERLEHEARLERLAQFDSLTGLPNRALLSDLIARTIARASRQERFGAVLFIDLDRFKAVNDTLGHLHGDLMLVQVGKRLRGCVRADDTVGRVSGDEFVVVLEGLEKPDDAASVARKILDALAAPYDLGGNEAYVTGSIGIAVFPADGNDAETLLKHADMAMYRAKESTRNTYCFFTAEMNERARGRMQLGNDLRRALERGQLRLHYQPKVDLASGRLAGVEALMRWEHPQRGLVMPNEFIPVLEDTGLIMGAGEWAIAEACAQIARWRAARLVPVPVAVNFSARQFMRQDLDGVIARELAAAGLEAHWLEAEITESCLLQEPEKAVRLLEELRAVGIRISVDDFGTGYSSLSYLTRLPLNALKIDRSFVKDLQRSQAAAAIVRSVIDLAHNLRFTVIAEGVETDAQLAFLRQYGCDVGQGYLFGRPQPAEEIEAQLERVDDSARPAGAMVGT